MIQWFDESPATPLAIKLMALGFLRASGLIAGAWSEINLAKARGDIPKERRKTGSGRTPCRDCASMSAAGRLGTGPLANQIVESQHNG
jgi:hypothetical protein